MFDTIRANISIDITPDTIGSVFYVGDTPYCVIGIESIRFKSKLKYEVLYTVQRVSAEPPRKAKHTPPSPSSLVKIVRTVPFSHLKKEDPFNIPNILLNINIGRVVHRKEGSYRIEQYTHIERTDTGIKIHMLAKPLSAMSVEETKAKHLEARKKKMNFTIIS